MVYVCKKMMQVLSAETGEVEWRMPGDEVPEAATWPGLLHYIHRGEIEGVEPPHSTYPTLPDSITEDIDKDSSAGERRASRRQERLEAQRLRLEELEALERRLQESQDDEAVTP
jgi:hypothetical protein